MVDVKLDVGDNPLNKLTGNPTRKASSFSVCNCLIYLTCLAGLAVIGLDAAEFISLGIVKDVMGLKVMKYEEYNGMATSLDELKKELEEVKKNVQSKQSELEAKTKELEDMTQKFNTANTEKTTFQNQVTEKENAVNAANAEKTTLSEQLEEEKKKVADLTAERDTLKAAAAVTKDDADAVTKDGAKEDGGDGR
mmetsp:Transcript_5215/g.6338  ORF Transcript_5215/g.6338 Transcript_5215/m.6338 type:complete len:194 (+) Transcript_5215:71-652(+)